MRIVFYNHTGQIGGAERVLLTIVRSLDRARFEPIVICPERGPLRGRIDALGVTTHGIAALKARFTFRPHHVVRYLLSFATVILQLRRRIVELDPDLIHANSVRAGLVATAATLGLRKRVVWHVHDLLPHRHPFNPLIRAVVFASRRTRIIAVAQASADRFTHSFLPLRNRVTVIRNGINVEEFRPSGETRSVLRDELQPGEHEPVIGIIGRLTPTKGQLELLHAFAEVLPKFPEAKLLIAGAPAFNREHEYAELLKRTVCELGIAPHVRFLGERTDIASVMQALDLLVLNSSSEACSLVLLEAMAAGLAVIATSVGGTPEIVEHAETGWLVPLHDHSSLMEALVTLLENNELRVRLGTNARRVAVARFSLDRFVGAVDSLYTQLDGAAVQEFAPRILDNKLATD